MRQIRKLLNVLYVTTPDSYVSRDGENVVISVNSEEKFRMPVHNLEGIVCFNYTGASPALMALCCERNVKLSFLTENGRFLARVTGGASGNVLLRRKQYRCSDDERFCTDVSKNLIAGKIQNSRYVLQRFARDHGEEAGAESVKSASKMLAHFGLALMSCGNLDSIRGVEGEAAREYYGVFDHLITEQKDVFKFKGRSRRPPLDFVNAVLSFLYVVLAHDCEAALETVGLDPQVGFLHRDRSGRAGLALDLMEELRPYLVDRTALTLINNRQVDPKGFMVKETGAVVMDDETRKAIIVAWQKRKQEEITHPFLDEKIKVGLIPYIQALLMSRFLRGDIDGYPPFLIR